MRPCISNIRATQLQRGEQRVKRRTEKYTWLVSIEKSRLVKILIHIFPDR